MAKIEKQYKMNFFDASANSNKVWIGTAFDDGLFRAEYGRVRENAKLAVTEKKFYSGAAALAELERKHGEKLRKGYRDTPVIDNSQVITSANPAELSRLAVEQIAGAAACDTTSELIKYLAQVNIHAITHATSIKYDASNATFRTPLGVLTPGAVADARNILRQIENANQQSWSSRNRESLICDYYRLVPADFGVKIPATSSLLNTADKIKEQFAVLDALDAAITSAAPTTETEKLFKCKLTKLPHWTDEGKAKFREIRALFEKTKNSSHVSNNFKLTRVYDVEIETMKAAFDRAAKRLGNVRADLWHGTRSSNLLSILKSGLMIPKSNASHCTGRMFGDGIYTSLQSTKALNYATDFWNKSGGGNQRTFMFLCEVALGKTYHPKSYGESLPKKGTDSSWVEAGSAGVLNHECIVYDAAQVNLKYLCEFSAQ